MTRWTDRPSTDATVGPWDRSDSTFPRREQHAATTDGSRVFAVPPRPLRRISAFAGSSRGDGTGCREVEPADEVSRLLARVAIVRGPGRAARLAAIELTREVDAIGGMTTELESTAVRRRWSFSPRPLLDASAHTLVVALDAPFHTAEQLAAALNVPVVEASPAIAGGVVAALRRAVDESESQLRPLLDVDLDGARAVTSGPVYLHSHDSDVIVCSRATPVVVGRDVRIVPGLTAQDGMRIADGGPERRAQKVVASAGGLLHVRAAGGWHSGRAVAIRPWPPLHLLVLGEVTR